MRTRQLLTTSLLVLLGAGSVVAGSGNDEHLLGPTGLLGQAGKKGITITKVEKGSPADGRIRPGDIIIGVGKDKFKNDSRRKFAEAVDEAESEEAGGKLTLVLQGNQTVDLQLKVMGRYRNTAPFDCPKSEAIIRQAADYLAQSTRTKGKPAQINAAKGQLATGWLGLMATGEPEYIDVVKQNLPSQEWAKAKRDDLMAVVKGDKDAGYVGWFWGYRLITLAEYHVLTGDPSVLPAIEAYAEALAMGQDAAGLWSHRMAIWSKNNGQAHGRCIGYGQMNQPSLTCFMGLLLARKCGVKRAEVDAAITRAHTHFNSYTHRGTLPYGVHDPNSRDFNNNGMSATAALCMSFHGNRESAAFFSRCSAASYERLESGHATYYFNVLWTPLGAHVAGPEVTRRFFQQSRWLQTLYRSWDGRFTHDGSESKEGNSTGAHLLAYCLPRRALFITGKAADESLWLKGDDATDAIGMSRTKFDAKRTDELLACLGSPFPQVVHPAIDALRTRKDDVIPKLVEMMQSGAKIPKTNAIRYFGYGCPKEIVLSQADRLGEVLRDGTADVEARLAAAGALAQLGEQAYPYYDDMLRMVVADEPGDPLRLADESLGKSLNSLCENPYASGLVKDKDLFYAAAVKLMDHKRQNTRSNGLRMVAAMPLEDFHRVADKLQYIIADRDLSYHSYHNPTGSIGTGIAIFAGFHIKEGLDYALGIGDMESGKGSFKMRAMMDGLAKYGANALPYVEQLKQRPSWQNVPDNPKLRSNWNNLIKAINEDKKPAKLITLEEAKALSNTPRGATK